MSIGPQEIVVVLVLALLVLGPKRLPQAGRSLGRAVRELKRATSSARNDLGIDEVAADVRDLKASVALDLKSADDEKRPSNQAPPATIDESRAPEVEQVAESESDEGSVEIVGDTAATADNETAETADRDGRQA